MFFVTVTTVRIDYSKQILEESVSTPMVVSTLEKAFEGALHYLKRPKDTVPAWENKSESLQILENGKIVAMATIKNGEAAWLKSPTIADVIQWSREMKNSFLEIESKGLNSLSEHNEQPFAFRVCRNVIDTARQKLMSLYQPRSNDEVYATLKRVEARLHEKASSTSYSFEMGR